MLIITHWWLLSRLDYLTQPNLTRQTLFYSYKWFMESRLEMNKIISYIITYFKLSNQLPVNLKDLKLENCTVEPKCLILQLEIHNFGSGIWISGFSNFDESGFFLLLPSRRIRYPEQQVIKPSPARRIALKLLDFNIKMHFTNFKCAAIFERGPGCQWTR